MSHTQGKLIHNQHGYPQADIKSENGRNIACTWGVNCQPKTKEGHEKQTEIARANARRLVACWNALTGIETEYLEQYGLPDFAQKISDLAEQRNELLEALKATQAALRAAWDNGTLPASVISAQIAQNNDAAIQKAEDKA